MAPIGPCSLKHLPCYISFWISHGGSLKNRASEKRKRGIDEDRWGRGAASVRQRCPFTQAAEWAPHGPVLLLVCSILAPLRSLCDQPVTCNRTNNCPASLKLRWANGAGGQDDVSRTDQSMERAGPAGRRDRSIFYFTVRAIRLQTRASCL